MFIILYNQHPSSGSISVFRITKYNIDSVLSLYHITIYLHVMISKERFAGLNFRAFHGFQKYRKSFSVNIYFMVTLFKCIKRKEPQKFFCENFFGWNLQKFSSVNLSPFYDISLYQYILRQH